MSCVLPACSIPAAASLHLSGMNFIKHQKLDKILPRCVIILWRTWLQMSGNLTAVRKSNKSDYLVKVGDFQGNIAVSKNCYWNRI